MTVSAIQTVRGCFSAVERQGYLQWASNAEPTYSIGTLMFFPIDSRTGAAGYSLAKPKVGAPKRKITPYCLNCSDSI